MGGTEWGDCVENGVATLRCIPIVFQNIVNAALIFVGVVAAFFIVYGGIKLATSGGDPKNVAQARQIITWAIVGVVIVLLSFAVIYFISYVTKVDCITKLDFASCK